MREKDLHSQTGSDFPQLESLQVNFTTHSRLEMDVSIFSHIWSVFWCYSAASFHLGNTSGVRRHGLICRGEKMEVRRDYKGKGRQEGQSERRKEERKETSLACFLTEIFPFFFQHEEGGCTTSAYFMGLRCSQSPSLRACP